MKQNSSPEEELSESEKDLRAAWAIGFSRAAEVSGIGMQFVLPTLAGWWLDSRMGTGYIFLGVGLTLGMLLSFFSLLHVVRRHS